MILLSVGATRGALSVPGIARNLSEAGRPVRVVLEPGADNFIGRAAFVLGAEAASVSGDVPEALVFVPAAAGTIARLAHGFPQGLVEDAYATGLRPAFVVPNLDPATAQHPAVRENIARLRADGCRVLEGPDGGMADVGEVVAEVLAGLGGPLTGLRIVVTAGGTREPIDSVRFVGNRSSGKMGVAIAREARRRGAEVSVVAANVERVEAGVAWYPVESVDELGERTMDLARAADVLVMAAAVSDFKPSTPLKSKVRRSEGLKVEFVATEDILKAVRERNPDLFMVGFAATHGNPVPDAREKLDKKGVNLVVGNDISREGIGFGADENEVYVVGRDGERFVPRASKTEIAHTILDAIAAEMRNGERQG